MEPRSISTIRRSELGKVRGKWEFYLAYYASLFKPLRNEPISLLEIGVQNCVSLETWH